MRTLLLHYPDQEAVITEINENLDALNMQIKEKKDGKEGLVQPRSQSMPPRSLERRVYPECVENEKEHHEAAVTLQLRIEGTVACNDFNMAVAKILQSAGIESSTDLCQISAQVLQGGTVSSAAERTDAHQPLSHRPRCSRYASVDTGGPR